MNKTLIKWCSLCTIGVFFFAFGLVRVFREDYNLVIIYLFVGVFLILASFKRIRLLKRGYDVLKEGKTEITVYYRDRNQVESKNAVIPVWSDAFYFYGFLTEENDIKTYRWEGIWRALENGQELEKEDIMKRLSIE